MFQKTNNQFKVLAGSVAMVALAFSLISAVGGGIVAQAEKIYSCPAGSTLSGSTCVTTRATKCSDLSAPDVNGNCSQGQSALFTCDGRPGQIVILEQSGSVSNNTLGTTLCTTRTFLFNRTEARASTGCNRTDYMLNPVDGRWISEYTMLANENNQARETQYCVGGARVCPVGQRLFYFPAGTFNRLLPETGIVCVIESFNFRDNGLLPIAAPRDGGGYSAECDASYDVISKWDWNSGDREINQICAKKSYKATAQAGTAVCPAGFSDTGTNCTAPATVTSNTPDGYLDGISATGIASGWATDADVPNTSLDVHFYVDGSTSSIGTYIGKTTANAIRPDLPAPYNTGNNGYTFRLPEAYCNGQPHTLYAYAIDAPTYVNNPLLTGSPKAFNLTKEACGYPTVIDNTNVKTGTCGTSNTAVQGSTVTCTFPLTGGSLYTLPSQGLQAALLVTNGNNSADYGKSNPCTVAGSVLTCSNIPVPANATIGAHEVAILQPTVQWMMNKGSVNVTAATVIATATEITQSNTGNGTCNPVEIAIGGMAVCTYPLTGDMTNSYKLPLTPIKSKISTVATSSENCQIFNNGTSNASLVCANIPTTGGTAGNQTASLSLAGETNTAPIKLISGVSTTIITSENTGIGKCTPMTITIGNLTLCDFPLTGGMLNNYSLPLSGVKAQISTANSLSNPCQISNNGTAQASLTCTQVPTSGATAGAQNAKLNLANETSLNPVMLAAATTTLGNNPKGELGGKVGSLVTGFITTTGSTYSGPATYTNGTNCTIAGVMSLGIFTPVQGTLVPMDCPLGELTNGVIKATGNVDLSGIKSNFAKTELTMEDLKKIDVVCNGGKAVIVNSTTTCTFELPANKILPKDLFFGIGDSKPAGTCIAKDRIVTCTNIPTGSKSGVQALNSKIGTGATFDTGKKITVNAAAVLVKTGNNLGFSFTVLALIATSFSLSLAGSLRLAKQKE